MNPVTAADIAAGLAFVAMNLDLQAGQEAQVSGFDLLVSVIGADYNNLQFVQVIIFRNLNLDPLLNSGAQLGAGTETVYNCSTAFLSERVIHREWNKPLPLPGPGRYAVYGQAFFGAFVGPTNYTLNVAGQIVQSSGQRSFPLQFR